MAFGHLDDLGQPDVDGPLRQGTEDAQAVLGDVEAHVHLLHEAFQPGQGVAIGAGDHPAGAAFDEELAVRQVGLIAPQVHVDA